MLISIKHCTELPSCSTHLPNGELQIVHPHLSLYHFLPATHSRGIGVFAPSITRHRPSCQTRTWVKREWGTNSPFALRPVNRPWVTAVVPKTQASILDGDRRLGGAGLYNPRYG